MEPPAMQKEGPHVLPTLSVGRAVGVVARETGKSVPSVGPLSGGAIEMNRLALQGRIEYSRKPLKEVLASPPGASALRGHFRGTTVLSADRQRVS